MQPIAGFLADFHASETPWAGRPGMKGDAEYALSQVVEALDDHGVKLLFLGGDILDKQRNRAYPLSLFARWMPAVGGYELFYVEGQHELDVPPWLSILPNAYHLEHLMDGVGVNADGRADELAGDVPWLRIRGLNFRPTTEAAEALAAVPQETDILVCHQVWPDFMGKFGQPGLSLGMVPHVRAIFTGDYHKYETRTVVKDSDGTETLVVSPGSCFMQSIDEPDDKYMLILWADAEGNFEFRPVPLKSRPVLRIEVNSPADVETVAAEAAERVRDLMFRAMEDGHLPEDIAKPIVQVIYPEDLQPLVGPIRKAYEPVCHLFLKMLKHKADDADGVESAEDPIFESTLSALPYALDASDKPQAFEACRMVLASNLPPAALVAEHEAAYLASEEITKLDFQSCDSEE